MKPLLPDEQTRDSGTQRDNQRQEEAGGGGGPISQPDETTQLGRQLIEVIETLTDAAFDGGGVVAAPDPAGQVVAQRLLDGGGAEGDADDGAEGAEQIRAGGGDGLVLRRRIRDDGDQRRRDADAVAEAAHDGAHGDGVRVVAHQARRHPHHRHPHGQETVCKHRQPVVPAVEFDPDAAKHGARDGRDDRGEQADRRPRRAVAVDRLVE